MPGFCHFAKVTAKDGQHLNRFYRARVTYRSNDPGNIQGRVPGCQIRDNYSGGSVAGLHRGQSDQT